MATDRKFVVERLMECANLLEIQAAAEREAYRFFYPVSDTISASTHEKLMFRIGMQNENVDKLPVLGIGSNGIAYKISRNRVLKITRDYSEANASIKLIGKHLDTIAEIYDVFAMKILLSKERYTPKGSEQYVKPGEAMELPFGKQPELKEQHPERMLYGIVQEYLTDADPTWQQIADEWYNFRVDKGQFERPIERQNLGLFFEYVEEKMAANPEFLKDVDKDVWQNWYLRLSKDLVSNGIRFRDVHDGNIMKRSDGSHVIIDLGASKSKISKIPAVARAQ